MPVSKRLFRCARKSARGDGAPERIERRVERHRPGGERAGLVAAQDVDAAEVLDRREVLHDHLLARHPDRALRERDGRDHRQELGREPDRERHREEQRLERDRGPSAEVHDQDEQHQEEHRLQDQHAEASRAALELGLLRARGQARRRCRRRRCRRPVAKTTAVAGPAHDRGAEEDEVGRVGAGRRRARRASRTFSAGSDSPVSAACCTWRSRASSRRASAGTRSPAASRITSPDTISAARQLAPARRRGARWRSARSAPGAASTARSERNVCQKLRPALSKHDRADDRGVGDLAEERRRGAGDEQDHDERIRGRATRSSSTCARSKPRRRDLVGAGALLGAGARPPRSRVPARARRRAASEPDRLTVRTSTRRRGSLRGRSAAPPRAAPARSPAASAARTSCRAAAAWRRARSRSRRRAGGASRRSCPRRCRARPAPRPASSRPTPRRSSRTRAEKADRRRDRAQRDVERERVEREDRELEQRRSRRAAAARTGCRAAPRAALRVTSRAPGQRSSQRGGRSQRLPAQREHRQRDAGREQAEHAARAAGSARRSSPWRHRMTTVASVASEVAEVVGDEPRQHGRDRGRARDASPLQAAHHQQRAAHPDRGQRLVGEELGQAERHERSQPRPAAAVGERALPDGAAAHT